MNDEKSLQKYLAYLNEVALSRRKFLYGTAGLAGLTALAACAPATTAPSAAAPAAGDAAATGPKTGGTLIFAGESIGESLEPGLWNGFGISNVIDNVAAYLTRPNSSGNWTDPPEPSLAESWEISADGLTYTFKIRQGVKFHDGSEVNALAIVRSLTRQVNPEDASYVEGLYMHTNYTFNRKAISASDDWTVVVELERPDAAYLYRLFHPSAIIISSQALDQYKADINANLISCGPFKVEKFVPGSEVTLAAFEEYWDGRPYLDKIVIRGYPDEGAMLAAIEAAEVNFAPYPPSSAIPRLREREDLKVMAGPPLINLFVGCCTLNAPLDNRDIRLAVDELLATGVSELDTEKRKQIYKEIQDLILAEMPYVMLAYYTKPVVMAANINDLPIGGASTERIFLSKVWMS